MYVCLEKFTFFWKNNLLQHFLNNYGYTSKRSVQSLLLQYHTKREHDIFVENFANEIIVASVWDLKISWVTYHWISRVSDGLGISFLGIFSVPVIRVDGAVGVNDIDPDSRKMSDLRPSLAQPMISQANTVRTVCYFLAKSSSLLFTNPLHHGIICALQSDMPHPDSMFDQNFKAWCDTGDVVRELRRQSSLRNNVGCRTFWVHWR